MPLVNYIRAGFPGILFETGRSKNGLIASRVEACVYFLVTGGVLEAKKSSVLEKASKPVHTTKRSSQSRSNNNLSEESFTVL